MSGSHLITVLAYSYILTEVQNLKIAPPVTNSSLIAFYLYPNPKDLNYLQEIKVGDKNSVLSSNYNSSNPLILLIHGFLNNYTTQFSQTVKNAYLQSGIAANVIVVDWGKLASPQSLNFDDDNNLAVLSYPYAVANVPRAADRVAQFINFLLDWALLSSPQNVHLVGFSLGAHVSGLTGFNILKSNLSPIGRISGLDPAGPLFTIPISPGNRLDSTSASFVDIVHTDKGRLGIIEDLGHVDFHVNGGFPTQPGCIQKSPVIDLLFGSCSHNRAWEYYIESLNKNFTACKCLNYVLYKSSCRKLCSDSTIFGEYVPKNTRGIYYVDISL